MAVLRGCRLHPVEATVGTSLTRRATAGALDAGEQFHPPLSPLQVASVMARMVCNV